MAVKSFRLNSMVSQGVGGPEAGAINYIYGVLLHEAGQDHYAISINQINTQLNEFVQKEPGKKIHINIRYPVLDNFDNKSIEEKNRFRLEVIHASMLRIAEKFNEYDISRLEQVKKKILDNDFSFEFAVKRFPHPRNKGIIAKIITKPLMHSFEYFAVKEVNSVEISRILFYSGITTFFYLQKFFQKAKWQEESKIILTGQDKIVETHVYFGDGRVEYINLTPYSNPPYFELMKAGISEENKEKYSKDWKHSLPPHIGAVLNYEAN